VNKRKIINDPIYGFIHLPNEAVYDCMEQPFFQRLRRIKQLGLTSLVYPGAQHTRFHHALGAMHLMTLSLESLKSKGVKISPDEEEAVILAILLHDVGHGPFSHTLEHSIMDFVHHEQISLRYMQWYNQQHQGKLDKAISIFTNKYHRPFFHQLVSSQLDMDRLDYLRRDSFYTGVSEGMVGIERIIQMLNVQNDHLVVDEKGIFSVEKFLMARRFMYWQVYLHKTSIAADEVLLQILRRSKWLVNQGEQLFASPYLSYFLTNHVNVNQLMTDNEVLEQFTNLDDNDIISAIKVWQNHPDALLSTLSKNLIERRLPKIEIFNEPISDQYFEDVLNNTIKKYNISREDASFMVTKGIMSNNAYNNQKDQINIYYKNGTIKDLASAMETYTLSGEETLQQRFYICYPKG
jgi:HD superfamily phosphohydrolase